jgi:DNA-3-methyladenine glycosylase II
MKPSAHELRALARRDPALGAVLRRLPPFPGFPDAKNRRQRSHYVALASAIVYQQLSGKAAATIFARVCALTPGPGFPEPAELRDLGDEALRASGLSGAKLAALRDLGERIDDGRLVLPHIGRKSDAEIIEHLTSVRGIGEWSAQMFLMFRLGRLDVMAEGDMGVQEGVRLLDGLKERPRAKAVLARAECWRPLRSVGCWMMWRLVERERAKARGER